MAGKNAKVPAPDAYEALGLAFTQADRNKRRLRGRESQLRDGQIGHSRFELLDILREIQPVTSSDLALAAGFTKPTISRMIDSLAAGGLVDRVRNEGDRRLVTVTLTKKGLETVEARRAFWGKRWREALQHFDAAELNNAAEILGRVAIVFEDPEAPIPPVERKSRRRRSR